jgi:hypothetical protein
VEDRDRRDNERERKRHRERERGSERDWIPRVRSIDG